MRFNKIRATAVFLALLAVMVAGLTITQAGPLTRDQKIHKRAGTHARYLMAADTIYAGSMVTLNRSGYAVAAIDSPGYRFVGIAMTQAKSAAIGSGYVDVMRTGEFRMNSSGTPSYSHLGAPVWLTNDNAIVLTQPSGGGIYAGEITEVVQPGVTNSRCYVDITGATRDQHERDVVLTGDLSAAFTGAETGGMLNLHNPFGEDVYITDAIFDVTTPTTGKCRADVGVSTAAMDSMSAVPDNLMDAVDVGTAAIMANNTANAGTNGLSPLKWPQASVVLSTGTSAGTGLVGTYRIHVLVPSRR